MTDRLKTLRAFARSNWSAGVTGLRLTAGRIATTTGLASAGQVEDVSRALLQAGDQLNNALFESLADCAQADGWTRNLKSVLELSTAGSRMLRPDLDGRAARQEFRNKLEVFRLVRYESPDHPPSTTDAEALRDVVEKAYGRNAHTALWVVEGAAHKRVARRLRAGEHPGGMFVRLPDGLPETCMPLLHAGLGLAAAEHLLDGHDPGRGDSAELVRQFVALCRDNADPALLDTALEALGLVARCFYPDSVPSLTEAVLRVAREEDAPLSTALVDYWWHGVGRGTYFVPLSFVPGYGTIGRAIDTVEREAPDTAARDASLAGLAYAFNMVNMAHPEILESLLRLRGTSLVGGAFARGMLASFVARQEITPDYPLLERFLAHRAGDADEAWDEMVRRPCRQVLAARTATEREAVLGQLYRSLGAR